MFTSIEPQLNLIEEEISKIKFPDNPKNLYDPLRYFLSLGGKRMRPALVLLGNELFGGTITSACPQAIAVELFHNFTLIHDDIMDRAELRRGKSALHKKWNENIAILSGDAMVVFAYQYLAQCDADVFMRIFPLFNKTAIEVCEGQQYDMDFETQEQVTIEDYIEMIRLKTSVLLGAALKIGALTAGANDKDADALYLFGQHLGIAFQLQDDLLDVYGDPEKFGKQKGGDIVANKKTFLWLSAHQLANEQEKIEMQQLLNEKNADKKVELITRLFDSMSIAELTRKEMDKHFQLSKNYLTSIPVKEELKSNLMTLAEQLMVRTS